MAAVLMDRCNHPWFCRQFMQVNYCRMAAGYLRNSNDSSATFERCQRSGREASRCQILVSHFG